MLTTLLLVAGPLLGGVISTLMQHRSAATARRDERAERERADQVAAVRDLVAALGTHQLAMWRRERLRLTGADTQALQDAREVAYTASRAVPAALTCVRILVPVLGPSACRDAEATSALRDADDEAALDTLRRAAGAATDRLIEAAADYFAPAAAPARPRPRPRSAARPTPAP